MNNIYFLVALAGCIATIQCQDCTTASDCTATLGTSSRCVIQSPCTTGTCDCFEDYGFYNGQCGPLALLGETCSSGDDGQCGENAECASNTCQCIAGYTEDGSWDCEPNTALGASCVEDGACIPFFSFCNSDGVCECNDDYYQSGSTCLPNDRGTQCTNDTGCMSFIALDCQNNVCSCLTSDLVEDTVTFMNIDFDSCFGPNSQRNLDEGAACTTDVTFESDDYRRCKSGLTCGSCPGSNATICIDSGASMASAGLIATILASIVASLM